MGSRWELEKKYEGFEVAPAFDQMLKDFSGKLCRNAGNLSLNSLMFSFYDPLAESLHILNEICLICVNFNEL